MGIMDVEEVAVLWHKSIPETTSLLIRFGLFKRRLGFAEAKIQESVMQARLAATEHKVATIRRHIDMGKQAEAIVGKHLEAIKDVLVKPSQLKQYMEAAKIAAELSDSAVGIGDKAAADAAIPPTRELGSGNTFIFNAEPGQPVNQDPYTINV